MDPITRLTLRYRLRPGDLGITDAGELSKTLQAIVASVESDDDEVVYRTALIELLGMEIAVWRTKPNEFTAPGQLTVKFDRAGILAALTAERNALQAELRNLLSPGGGTSRFRQRPSVVVSPEVYDG